MDVQLWIKGNYTEFNMLSMSKTIDCEIWLSIIENRKALATDNRLISIIVTSLIVNTVNMEIFMLG